VVELDCQAFEKRPSLGTAQEFNDTVSEFQQDWYVYHNFFDVKNPQTSDRYFKYSRKDFSQGNGGRVGGLVARSPLPTSSIRDS